MKALERIRTDKHVKTIKGIWLKSIVYLGFSKEVRILSIETYCIERGNWSEQ